MNDCRHLQTIDDIVKLVNALNVKIAELKHHHSLSKRLVYDRLQGGGDYLL